MDYLNRSQAPFGADLWDRIDEAAVAAARDMVTARRFLDVDGPYGVGLTSIELGNDNYCREPKPGEAGAVVSRAISVPMIRRSFNLSIRRIAGVKDHGQPLDLSPVEDAAEAVAAREEEFIYYGNADFGLPGLLTAEGRNRVKGGDWSKTDQALPRTFWLRSMRSTMQAFVDLTRWCSRPGSTTACSGVTRTPTCYSLSIWGVCAPTVSSRPRSRVARSLIRARAS